MPDKSKNEQQAEGARVAAAFDVVESGYAQDQVDAYVRTSESTIADLRGRATELERQLRAQRRRTNESSDQPYARLGARVENLLRLAEDEAADIAARARRQYEQVLAEARKSAAETVRVATSDAKAVRAEADTYQQGSLEEVGRQRDELRQREDDLNARVERLRAALEAAGPIHLG